MNAQSQSRGNAPGCEPVPGKNSQASRNVLPWLPLVLAAALAACACFPRIAENAGLTWSFLGAGAVVAIWTLVLGWVMRRHGRSFSVEFIPPAKSHYVQAAVQMSIYTYWGWYWQDVYGAIPMFLGQLVFLYAVDGLLSWSRGLSWRFGCAPLPVILSTNIFLWFKDDWFVFQFLLIAACALGKAFIQWNRDGRRVHVFNPSAFGLALCSVILIFTNTVDYTWVGRIADTFASPPNIYFVVFVVGLVVQYFFSTTLITLSAAVTLALLGLMYFGVTGVYYFIFTNIPAPVFLGLHLLVTDPATSPRTNIGKVLFGCTYGVLTFAFYGILAQFNHLTVFDKLLPIPILNLLVPVFDRAANLSLVGAMERLGSAARVLQMNLLHMGVWAAVFLCMVGAGFVAGQQEGSTDKFWRKAVAESRPGAAHGLVEVLKWQARAGHAAAYNELGIFYTEGRVVPKDIRLAAQCYSKASKLGSLAGSSNLVHLYLSSQSAGSIPPKSIGAALDHIEREYTAGGDPSTFYMIGYAYESGRGRERDVSRALEIYEAGCKRGDRACCKGAERLKDPSRNRHSKK